MGGTVRQSYIRQRRDQPATLSHGRILPVALALSNHGKRDPDMVAAIMALWPNLIAPASGPS